MTTDFPLIFLKMMPLYLNILLGYIAGKTLNASRDTISKIMFYMINPLIILNGVLNVKLTASSLSLPLLIFLLSSALCLVFFAFSKNIWEDASKNNGYRVEERRSLQF